MVYLSFQDRFKIILHLPATDLKKDAHRNGRALLDLIDLLTDHGHEILANFLGKTWKS